MATFEIQMPDGGVYQVEAPEGTTDAQAYQYALTQVPPPEPEVGIGEAFSTGFERGVGRLGSTVTDIIPALVGSAVGADEYAQRQFQEAAEKEAALPAPIFPSYKDVEGVGDFTKFVAETIGEQIPNLGVALGTALTGGAAAPVLGATRAAGQFAGAAFGSYALNAPEIFQNIYQETGETAPGTALLFGSAAAALDSVLPAALAKNISGPVKAEVTKKLLERSGMNPSVLRSGTTGLLKGLGTEGLTEGAQESISIAAERLIDENPDIFGSKEFDRIMEASVRGAVAGGGFGTVGGITEGVREKGEQRRELRELEEAKTLQEKAEKREAELNSIVDEVILEQEEAAATSFTVPTQAAAAQTPEQQMQEFAAQQDALAAEAAEEARIGQVAVEAQEEADTAIARQVEALEAQRDARARREEATRLRAIGRQAPAVVEDAQRGFQAAQLETEVEVEQPSATQIPATKKELQQWGRENLGIGPTAAVLREDGPLAGKDLTDPAQAAEVREVLTSVQEASKSATVPVRIDDYLKQDVFEAAPATAPIAEPVTEEVTQEVVEPVEATPAAPAVEPTAEPVVEAAPVEPTGEAAIASEQEQAAELAAAVETETTDFINREIYEAKLAAGRIANGKKLSGLTIEEQQEAIADNVFPEDTEVVKQADGLSLGLSRLLSAYRGYVTGDNTQTANPEAAQKLVAPIEKIIGKEQADALLPNIASASPEAFANMLSQINSRARTSVNTVIREEILPKYGRKNAPVYKGAAFSPEISQLAERGRLAPLLNKLIPSQSPEIQRVLRKIGAQNLRTRIVVAPTPEGTSGFYDAATDTITLDPTNGMNEHTALHEITHAALAQALNNPDLQITKDFFDFYSQIVPTMDGFYGGQDLQEFTAELVGNPEFQALLKQVKAPEGSKTMWQTIMDAIAKFFGFRKGQSAYDKGLDFIDSLLDVSQDVEPTLTDQLFLGTPKMGVNAIGDIMTSGKELAGKKKESLLDGLSKLGTTSGGGRILSNALRALRLNDLVKLYGDKIPALGGLRDAILQRQGAVEKARKAVQLKYISFKKIVKKKPEQAEKLAELASEARREGFDLVGVDPEFDVNELSTEQKRKFNAMQRRLQRLDSDVQGMYKDMREDYRRMYDQYKQYVLSQVTDGKKRAELEARFLREASAPGYVPFLRFGDYFLDYTDPATGERAFEAFESPRKRQQFIEANRNRIQDEKQFDRTANAVFNKADFPPTSFVRDLMDALPAEQQSIVYDQLLNLYPENSFMQRTRKADLIKGETKDLVQGYADTMLKWATKQGNLEYLPEIQKNMNDIKSAKVTGVEASVVEEIGRREGFISNPTYGPMTSFFATSAYNLFLTGNVSSAIVNLSAVPLLSGPLLVGVYGFRKSNAALLRAMRVTKPSLSEWNSDTQTFEPAWTKDPKYASLVEGLDAMGQREHTMQREILEGSRQSTQDYDALGAKVMNIASLPFTEAEKYSRATTAVAAYDLAKAAGKSDAQAVEEAVKLTMDVHTSGMAAEGPSLMQGNLGRVMFTFKSFIWNSAVITAMATNNALRGEGEIRSIARKQVLGIYGMSAAIAGINGLPFYGAAATLANMMAALLGDDDEPFNAKEEMRSFTNEFLYKGPLNYITNLEISNRVGLANGLLFREDPYSIEQNGYVMTAIMQAMGPVGSYALNIERNAGRLLEQGEYGRFFESISPSALRNILKTGRYIQEGARTIDGKPIVEDLNGYNLALQAFGFSPADLSSLYENRAAALNYQSQVRNKKQKILKKYYIGVTTGDSDLMREALREFNEFSRNFPGLVGPDTLDRSFKSRQAYEKDLVLGMKFDKGLQSRLNEKFLADFIEP